MGQPLPDPSNMPNMNCECSKSIKSTINKNNDPFPKWTKNEMAEDYYI